MQDELLAVDVDRVAGVVSALIARDDRKARRQQVDDLALALVAPLGAQHCDVRCHAHIVFHRPAGCDRQKFFATQDAATRDRAVAKIVNRNFLKFSD